MMRKILFHIAQQQLAPSMMPINAVDFGILLNNNSLPLAAEPLKPLMLCDDDIYTLQMAQGNN